MKKAITIVSSDHLMYRNILFLYKWRNAEIYWSFHWGKLQR